MEEVETDEHKSMSELIPHPEIKHRIALLEEYPNLRLKILRMLFLGGG